MDALNLVCFSGELTVTGYDTTAVAHSDVQSHLDCMYARHVRMVTSSDAAAAARANGEASSSSGEEENATASIAAAVLLRDAARGLAAWTRQGGAARALLVASVSPFHLPTPRAEIVVGSVALAALTGLVVVVFVLVAATTSAAAVSVLVCLPLLAAAYIGALSVVVFVVAATTAATLIAITIATGKIHQHSRLLLSSAWCMPYTFFFYKKKVHFAVGKQLLV
uniref:Uncharacterized protein n=1 Tax=Leersia perrieri TaxID=77586 RepID=A0A0D9XDF3_9ORYZ